MFISLEKYARTLPPRLPNHPPKNLRRQNPPPSARQGVVAPSAMVPVRCARQRASTEASSLRCASVRPTGSGSSAEPSKKPAAPNAGCHGRTSHGPFSCAASSPLRVPVAQSRFPRGANDLAASKMDSSIPKRFHASKILLKTCLKCLCDVECLAIRRVSAKGQTWVDGG